MIDRWGKAAVVVALLCQGLRGPRHAARQPSEDEVICLGIMRLLAIRLQVERRMHDHRIGCE
jgi:hypothetical protein